ncbi:t-SNARE [Pilobolus umbonatus]|nr:t-SNARE [Pilobolus umbonatus]
MSYSFSRDRINELRSSYREGGNQYELQEVTTHTDDLTGFFQEVDRLKNEIDVVNYEVDQIENLHNNALSSFNEQQSKQLARDLERIKGETQRRNATIKSGIQGLESVSASLPVTADTQMRATQISAIRKRFIDTIQRYQDMERNYQMKYRQRMERQIRIVKPDASQDEVDNIIDSDRPPQVFAQSLMSAGRQVQAKAVLDEVQTRHDDIKHIERTIVELHQLFMDMSMMIEQQGQVLNTVENNADQTAEQVKEGNSYIGKAIKSARATRAKKWCCFFLCIGICVMIAILVWWFAFDHVGVNTNQSGK